MKCTAYSRAERSSPADGVSSCKQSPRLSLSSAAPLKNTTLVVFFNLCKVCLHKFVRFISKIARGACRLRSAIENTSCSHRLLLPSEISRQTSRRYGVPFFVCVPHTSKNFAGGFVDCVRGFFLQAISASSLVVSSSLNIVCSRRIRRVFLMRFLRICAFWKQIARGACRLRSATKNTSCSHRLLLPFSSSFCRLLSTLISAKALFVWFFNLKISWIFL